MSFGSLPVALKIGVGGLREGYRWRPNHGGAAELGSMDSIIIIILKSDHDHKMSAKDAARS